jgi:small subunit ribosomal protein S8
MLLISKIILKLKNAISLNKKFIFLPKNDFCINLLYLLYSEGFILGFYLTNSKKKIKIFLKTESNGSSIIKNVKLISTPSNNHYLKYSHLTKLTNGIGIIILSTPYGLFTSNSCIKKKIGGIAICHIT